MNNLYRELAPVSDAAWAQIEDEARRTFTRNVAARRVVDVVGPGGFGQAAVGTGHLVSLDGPAEGVIANAREVKPLIELRVPFTVTRVAIDDVERGAADPDWQPVKDAAQKVAFAEDRLVVEGFGAGWVTGIAPSSSNAGIPLPGEAVTYPYAVSQALSALRLAGVDGPYALLLPAEAYTLVSETVDHGYPIRQHLSRVLGDDGQIVWAPALSSAVLLSTRGGDYELHLGQDLSIGYSSHDATTVTLYLQETLTALVQTTEASVVLSR